MQLRLQFEIFTPRLISWGTKKLPPQKKQFAKILHPLGISRTTSHELQILLQVAAEILLYFYPGKIHFFKDYIRR